MSLIAWASVPPSVPTVAENDIACRNACSPRFVAAIAAS